MTWSVRTGHQDSSRGALGVVEALGPLTVPSGSPGSAWAAAGAGLPAAPRVGRVHPQAKAGAGDQRMGPCVPTTLWPQMALKGAPQLLRSQRCSGSQIRKVLCKAATFSASDATKCPSLSPVTHTLLVLGFPLLLATASALKSNSPACPPLSMLCSHPSQQLPPGGGMSVQPPQVLLLPFLSPP